VSWNIQDALSRLEERISELENREKELEKILAEPEIIRDKSKYLPLLNEYGEVKEEMEVKPEHKQLLKSMGVKEEDFRLFDGKFVRYEYDEEKGVRLYDPYYMTSYNEYIDADGWSSWSDEKDTFMSDILKEAKKKAAQKEKISPKPTCILYTFFCEGCHTPFGLLRSNGEPRAARCLWRKDLGEVSGTF
jgi:hypothetical protein